MFKYIQQSAVVLEEQHGGADLSSLMAPDKQNILPKNLANKSQVTGKVVWGMSHRPAGMSVYSAYSFSALPLLK